MLRRVLGLTLVLSLTGVPSALRAQSELPRNPGTVGYLDFQKRQSQIGEGQAEFSRQYSSAQGLRRVAQIIEFLESFRTLTETARGKLSASELQAAGNTSGEMQSLGFHNIPVIVEGTILNQEYQLTQVRYELAELRRERGEITAQELTTARQVYADTTTKLQVFLDTRIRD